MMVDVSPLPKKVNPFLFVALQMREQLKTSPPDLLKQIDVKELQQQILWLEDLASLIDYKTDRPMLCFLLAGLANNGVERDVVRTIIKKIDAIVASYDEKPQSSGYKLPED